MVHLLCDFVVAAGVTSVIGLYRKRQTHPTARQNYTCGLWRHWWTKSVIIVNLKKEIGQLWLPESTYLKADNFLERSLPGQVTITFWGHFAPDPWFRYKFVFFILLVSTWTCWLPPPRCGTRAKLSNGTAFLDTYLHTAILNNLVKTELTSSSIKSGLFFTYVHAVGSHF